MCQVTPPCNFERFGAQWTPTIQLLDPDGTKRHQFEGFLPPDDFLAQLKLGLDHSDFARQQWKQAENRYEDILRTLPGTDAAPEALYWLGGLATRTAAMVLSCNRRRKHSRIVTVTAHGQRRLLSGPSKQNGKGLSI